MEIKKRTAVRRRKRSLLIGNLCGFHEAQSSSTVVFGGLIKERLFAVANAHCSLATSAVSRSTVIYHCLWRSVKKNGCMPSQSLTAHWQPLRFHEAHSSSIVFGGLIKRTVVRRRKRSLLIGNLCGFTKHSHLPLSLEV